MVSAMLQSNVPAKATKGRCDMQATRQRILEILKEHSQATIEELAEALGLTSVTIRHHLDILRGDGLVEVPEVKRRTTPGRPQYVYTLTDAAGDFFPKNYSGFTNLMISEIRDRLEPTELDRILRGMAIRMAAEAPQPISGETFEQRLTRIVKFLNEKGYIAKWEKSDSEGYYLHAGNCPYHDVSHNHSEVCVMDMTLISSLLGVVPERVSWMSAGEDCCSYHIPLQAIPAS
jgi:predicted ArsR family transcriptional regulator